MSEELDFIEEPKKSRPGFLTVLGVLSFISLGTGLLFGLFNLASGPETEAQMLENKVELTASVTELKNAGMDSFVAILEQIHRMSVEVNDNFYLAGFLNLIIVGLGLFGVIKMFQGIKLGFHVYIVYCLLAVGSLYLYVSPQNIPNIVIIFNLIMSALFIFMYSRNLKWMK